jgi:hypothetical protein
MDRRRPAGMRWCWPAGHRRSIKSAMRTFLFLAAVLLAPAANAETLADLHWLKGCWRTSGDGPVITEVWSAPPMPAMIGYSYTVGEGETQGWEAMRIEMIDGAPTFIGMPSGGGGVRFRMYESGLYIGDSPRGGVGMTFVNPDHDYPQWISYGRRGNALTAVISRMDGSDEIRFEYRRISCAANLRP